MEKRIILELRGRSPSQVEELNLDNSRTNQIDGLTDEYTNLKILSLNNVGLTTLKGFPTLPSLRKLELSDNRISNGLNFLKGCKKLSHLNLSGNKIKTLDTLKPLEEFENLRNLDLFNNDVTSIDDYRVKVFALLPLLKYLDGFDQEDREVEDSSVEDEDEQNGNDDSASDVDLDLGPLVINNEGHVTDCTPENKTPLPMVLYTIYGLLFHMSNLLKKSEDSEDGEEGDISLSAVYNEHLEEETSGGSLYDGSDDDIDDDEDDDEDNDERFGEQNNKTRDGEDNADAAPEESTRGKKRKHESEEEDNN